MGFFSRLPIRRKLTLIILLTSTAAMLLVGGAMMIYETIRFRHTLVRELSTEAEIIAANSAAALAFSDATAAWEILNALEAQPAIVDARLFSRKGEMLAEFSSGEKQPSELAAELPGYRFENGCVLVFRQVRFAGEVVGSISLRSDLREQKARLKASGSIALTTFLSALLVSLLLSLKLQRIISTPILDLAEVAHQVTAEKNYSLRAIRQSDDEIGVLVEQFNQMLAQIGQRDAELRASSERFRQMAESIREVFWLTDLEKNEVFYVSPGFESIWGCPRSELQQSPRIWLDFIHDDDKARIAESASTKQASGEYDEEYRIVRPDGSVRWIHDRGFPVYDENGNLYRLAGIAEDITRRKQTEHALQLAEAKYRNIFENAIEGIFQTSPEGRFLAANPALARMLGYESPEELIASVSGLAKDLHVDFQVRMELSQRLRVQDEVHGFGHRLRRKDGSEIWVSLNVRVERDSQGNALYYEGTIHDITERRQIEEALRQSETQYRRLVELAQEGIWSVDVEGITSYANPHMVKMLGYTREEMVGKHLFEFMDASGRESCQRNLDRRKQGISESHEFEFIRKDGRRILTSMETAPITDANGTYCGAIACVSDITERKRAEETLRRTEQLYRKAITGAGAVPYAYEYKTRSYLFMGEGIEKLTGYASHEIRPESWKDLKQESVMMGETGGLTIEEAAKRVASGEVKSWWCDMRVKTREGHSRWISDVSVQILDEAGKLIGTMGILQDITERKQAEKRSAVFSSLASRLSAATTSEEAARNIMETANELIGWDSGFVHLYDRERDEIVPILTYDLVNGERIPVGPTHLKAPSPLARCIMKTGALLVNPINRAGLPFAFVPFGTERTSTSMMYVPVRQSDDVIGVLSIQRYSQNSYGREDLVLLQALADHCSGALQRIRATRDLLEAEAKYRRIFEDATEGIFQTTPAGNYLRGNPALARMFGYTSPEHMISSVTDIEKQTYVLPERRRELKRLLETYGSVQGFEAERYRNDGSRFWISINARAVRDTNGSILHYEGTTRDVTARRHLEMQLIEISDREQSRMGQDLHDGLCQHLVRTAFAANLLEKDLSSQSSVHLDQAKKVAAFVDGAITQARNLARGLYPVKLEVEGLHSAMQELAANIRLAYNIDCEFEFDGCSASINDHAVAMHLYRIAQEGAINAAKHANPSEIRIRLHTVADQFLLAISDNGTGITTSGLIAEGMGLHIMNYRAGMIGASLKIEPRQGGGTIVSCLFEHRSGIEKETNQ